MEKASQLAKALIKCELGDMMEVQESWAGEPIIFDLVNIRKERIDSKPQQPIINELNEKAYEILNNNKKN